MSDWIDDEIDALLNGINDWKFEFVQESDIIDEKADEIGKADTLLDVRSPYWA